MAALLHRAKLSANVEDVDFNPDDFVARVNSDLVGKYVNIASRCAGFLSKRFEGRIGSGEFEAQRKSALTEFSALAPTIGEHYEAREFGKALREVMYLADIANQYVDRHQPWDLAKKPEQSQFLQHVCSTRSTCSGC